MFRDIDGQGQRYPFDWNEALRGGTLTAQTLRCPLDRSQKQSSYTYLGHTPMLVPAARYVLAYETFHNHKGEGPPGHLVAFANQRVAWVSTQQLQAMLRNQQQGIDR